MEAARQHLQVITRDKASVRPLPDDGTLVIGRAPSSDIHVDDRSVSRRHAELVVEGRRVKIVDLGSRNGTQVNGKRLAGQRALDPGDVVSIGPLTLVLRGPAGDATITTEAVQKTTPTWLALGEREVLIASPGMARAFELLRRLAPCELAVLIRGETGVGKENAAFAVHHWSGREGPFVPVNCAAIPESLVESELFGHVRGAFTGATASRSGLFTRASGGTLFLDELGELSPAVQAKLLRALEERAITPVGAPRPEPVDVRLVAATNRDLARDTEAGGFRRDLYFRLSGATIELPPLRERVLEVPALAAAFLERACAAIGRPPANLDKAAIPLLLGHVWPGNVRELKHLMEYAAATIPEATIGPEHLRSRLDAAISLRGADAPKDTPSDPKTSSRPPLADELRALERTRIVEALERAGGVQKKAAALIGMPLRTFAAKVKQYGLRKG